MISMIDNGRNDEKIIAIPFNDPNYNTYKDISELPIHIFNEMSHFFSVYKALENKETAVNEVSCAGSALKTIEIAIESYIKNFCR
jgi:inorganic pyrophosphatase